MEDDRIIGCLPGETPASIVMAYQAIERARVASENRRLLDVVATLESELAEARALLVTALEIIETPYYMIGKDESEGIKRIAAAVEKARKLDRPK